MRKSTLSPAPFGLSLSFDKLRMIGNTSRQNTKPIPFGLSLSKPRTQSQATQWSPAKP
jgi:hypothetical protein